MTLEDKNVKAIGQMTDMGMLNERSYVTTVLIRATIVFESRAEVVSRLVIWLHKNGNSRPYRILWGKQWNFEKHLRCKRLRLLMERPTGSLNQQP